MFVTKAICEGLSDPEIIRQSLEDMDYFSCLYERYAPRLLRYIRTMGIQEEAEAADVLQDAFIKIWKNLNGFDPGLKASSWLYRIVHNEAISYMRRKHVYGKKQNALPLDVLYTETQGLSEPELALRTQITHQTLQQLPDDYREVLVLRYFESMRYDEISDVLKIPEGTVATRLNRAKKQFAAMVGKPEFLT